MRNNLLSLQVKGGKVIERLQPYEVSYYFGTRQVESLQLGFEFEDISYRS